MFLFSNSDRALLFLYLTTLAVFFFVSFSLHVLCVGFRESSASVL